MQPHVHAQPRVRVIVIGVKCYNIIRPQHIKCKQNGGWAKYCAFFFGKHGEKKVEKSQKIAQSLPGDDFTDTSAADVLCHLCFY